MKTQVKIGVLICKGEKQLLLIKEKYPKKKQPLWNIVKGTYGDISKRETISAAVQREAFEEASVRVHLNSLIGFYSFFERGVTKLNIVFKAAIVSGSPKPSSKKQQRKRKENISEIRWFDRNALNKMRINDFASPVAYFAIQDWLKKGSYPLDIFKETQKIKRSA